MSDNLNGNSNLIIEFRETFQEVWQTSVDRAPTHIALEIGSQKYSYHAMDLWSRKLEVEIRGRSRNPRTSVGRVLIYLKRSARLHAAVLAVLRSGGTYVPVDSEVPMERVRTIFDECSADLILMDEETIQKNQGIVESHQILEIRDLHPHQLLSDDEIWSLAPALIRPEDPAYIIFTSGSTGKPKGIEVSHRSLCHFLASENSILGIHSEDRVWQGFSVAFDMWIEETLMTFSVGATLIVATQDDVRGIDSLSDKLVQNRITVLHIVPTLAAAISEAVLTLRIVNFGGEACPPSVVKKWARPNRKLYNTYGPTETTVTATMTELFPDRPVTIGKALPNYTTYVVNENLEPVSPGESGELLIGGPGVSLGYINRPELNLAKFITRPSSLGPAVKPWDERLYRTGDWVRVNSDGDIEFHGRIDSQIKIRGFRVELEEIETVLLSSPGVRLAAVKHETAGSVDELIAFVVLQNCEDSDRQVGAVRERLRAVLPSYMIPNEIVVLKEMPTLTSGKIDRKALPSRDMRQRRSVALSPDLGIEHSDLSSVERLVLGGLQKVFGDIQVHMDADFFNDLGGHSLLAAAFVSELRSHPQAEGLSITDVYKSRTPRKIAQLISESSQLQAPTEHETKTETAFLPSAGRVRWFSLMQTLGFFPLFGALAVQFLTPFLGFSYFYERSESLFNAAFGTLGLMLFIQVGLFASILVLKRIWIGKFTEGSFPLYGAVHLKWWFFQRLKETVPTFLLYGSPLAAHWLRALGVRIGESCDIGQIQVDAEDLLEIGNSVSLSSHSVIDNVRIENGWLKFGRVRLGDRSFVGTSAVLCGNSILSADGELGDLSCLNEGEVVPPFEIWKGSPAQPVSELEAVAVTSNAQDSGSNDKRVSTQFKLLGGYSAAILFLSVFPVLSLLPVVIGLYWTSIRLDLSTSQLVLLSPIFALAYYASFLSQVWGLRWLVLGRLPAGTYSVDSLSYFRKWFVDQLSQHTLNALHPMFATMYLPAWFRALGVKVGQRAEISTASALTYHLVEVGDESFIADRVVLGDPVIRGGQLHLKTTRIGERSFIGNSAILVDGTHWPDRSLLGVLSVSPESPELVKPGSTWLGVPAQELPRREFIEDVDTSLTFRPKLLQKLERGFVEAFRILLPSTITFVLASFVYELFQPLVSEMGWVLASILAPILFIFSVSLPSFFSVVLFKWIAVGKYQSSRWPMWTRQVWWSEAVTAVYESLAVNLCLNPLKGSWLLPLMLRLLGLKVGRRVLMDTTDFTEFDMVEIGDSVILEYGSGAQTHLFEDRVMKVGRVVIQDRSQVQTYSIILYDTEIDRDVVIEANSLVMKGERLPSNSRWQGIPSRSARKNSARVTRNQVLNPGKTTPSPVAEDLRLQSDGSKRASLP